MDSLDMLKLSECKFSDMYITNVQGQPIVIRSLEYQDGDKWISVPSLSDSPEFLRDDCYELFKRVLKNSKTLGQDEVGIRYDGVNYRCARIVAPEGLSIRKNDEIQTWCLRRISSDVIDFGVLPFDKSMKTYLHHAGDGRGLILVAGAFGSGKTTTASSLLNYWVTSRNEVAVTLEDPPEVALARMSDDKGTIFQVDMTEKSQEEGIKKLRRWAPRYVLLGEIRTAEASQELLQISQSGPLVISTIHASDPVSAITALVRFASGRMSENDARDMIARTLLAVVYQEKKGKHFMTRMLTASEKEDHIIRTNIRIGQFHRIEEEMERQEKNRSGFSSGPVGR